MTRKSSYTPQYKSNADHSIGIREKWYAAFHYCKAIDTESLELALFVLFPTIPRFYQFDFEYQTMAHNLVVHSQ